MSTGRRGTHIEPIVFGGHFDEVLDIICNFSPNAQEILDVGCGGGFHLVELLRKLPFAKGMGIDPSPFNVDVAIKRAAEKDVNAVFEVGTSGIIAERYAGHFDLIISHFVTPFVFSLPNYLDELKTLTKRRSGVICIREFCMPRDWAPESIELYSVYASKIIRKGYEVLGENKWDGLFSNLDFNVVFKKYLPAAIETEREGVEMSHERIVQRQKRIKLFHSLLDERQLEKNDFPAMLPSYIWILHRDEGAL